MRNKSLFVTGALMLAALFLSACTTGGSASSGGASQSGTMPASQPASSAAAPSSSGSAAGRVFTLEELATYNGKDGQPAYVAVDGVVYDVTDVPQWANGEHMDGLTAGQDLTDEITNQSPHGLSALDGLPVVGTLE